MMVENLELNPNRWWSNSGIRLHLLGFGVAFTLMAFDLFWSPLGWIEPPTYRILFQVLRPMTWAWLFLFVGLFKIAATIRYPRLAFPAFIFGTAISSMWFIGLTVQFIALPRATPVVNCVTWALLVYLHLREVARVDFRRTRFWARRKGRQA